MLFCAGMKRRMPIDNSAGRTDAKEEKSLISDVLQRDLSVQYDLSKVESSIAFYNVPVLFKRRGSDGLSSTYDFALPCCHDSS